MHQLKKIYNLINRIHKESTSYNNHIQKKNKIQNCISIFLVIATICMVIISICQYYAFNEFSKKNSRAYLSVVNPILDTLEAYGSTDLRIIFSVQNTGKTPAYDVNYTIIFEQQLPARAVIPDTINIADSSKYIYAPGEFQMIKLFKQINIPEENFTKDDNPRLFFTGRFEYVDIFNQCHWLTFAYEYVFRPKIGGMLRPYSKGNNTDKN